MSEEKKTALVIDDEESLREIISEVLGLLEINAVLAEDGSKGIDIVKKDNQPIDLVIIDMFMPVLSGEETYNELKTLIPDCPVLFMSGYDHDTALSATHLNDKVKFIKKPFTISQFKDVVSTLV